MKKSIIKKIEAKDKFKEMYKFELTMENGDVGIIYKVENDPKVSEGDEKHYTLKPNGSMKIVNPEYQNNSTNYSYKATDDETNIRRAVALKTGVQFAIAKEMNSDQAVEVAEKFLKFLNNETTKVERVDDLPF
mgnify:FL=1|tara:strand:+ start:23586 stop:23984 length:399 start_codon:yes stop_codon:yes gene_type:complete